MVVLLKANNSTFCAIRILDEADDKEGQMAFRFINDIAYECGLL